jgi:parallel beta-helix repeat protein
MHIIWIKMKIYRFHTLLFCALAVVLAACGASATTQPPAAAPSAQPSRPNLPPQPVPPALAALAQRTRPCDALSAGQPLPDEPVAEAGKPLVADAAVVHYDDDSNTIELRRGANTTLAGIAGVLDRQDVLHELVPGEWLLAANLRVEAGATLRIATPEARWLKLKSDDASYVWLKALGGQIDIAGSCVTSWDGKRNTFDQNYRDGRGFILARDGGRLDIQRADLRYLGFNGAEAYGIAWRLAGTTGQIVDSFVSHNFYGLYSFEVNDLVIRGTEAYANVMYGIDPHTQSNRLVIENNVAHHNGKHGIILAEECSDGLIRGNVSYENLHHGIVVYQRSNNNLIEGNVAFGNGGQGINVNDSANTVVRANTVYDNLEAGIGVGQKSSASQVVGNHVFANRRDGVMIYSDARDNALRQNTVGDNARYGIYVKSAGGLEFAGNQVTGNLVGVYLNVAQQPEISSAANQIHGNHEADVSRGQDTAAVAEGEEHAEE